MLRKEEKNGRKFLDWVSKLRLIKQGTIKWRVLNWIVKKFKTLDWPMSAALHEVLDVLQGLREKAIGDQTKSAFNLNRTLFGWSFSFVATFLREREGTRKFFFPVSFRYSRTRTFSDSFKGALLHAGRFAAGHVVQEGGWSP